MEELTKQKSDRRVWLGGLLIIIGGLFLLNSLDILDFRFSRIIISWPFFFFIIGIYVLVQSEKKIFGAILAGLGALFLLPRIFPGIVINWSVVFPLILIAVGLYIILHRRKNFELIKGTIKDDVIDDVNIFGGGEKVITSNNFKGGNITAIFGGSEINLTQCKLAEGINTIDIFALFGGTTIIVPKNWNVIVNVTALLGGFSNKGIKDPTVEIDMSRSLVIKGLVVFGGGEIKNF